ncbi:MAG: GNAT family N-acetyltransferase [Thiobacillus sp.]
MQARFYTDADAEPWDAFCAAAYGATFLHSRRFLSYHGDRFVDRSVIVEHAGEWLGVMPAARHPQLPDVAVSHPGITYGGLVHQGGLRGLAMVDALVATSRLLHDERFGVLRYKATPHIYHRSPAQDDLYALHRLGARRVRCDLSSCIDLSHRLPVGQRRLRGLKKAIKSGVALAEGIDHVRDFWQVLEENLQRKHGARPTHTVEEILLLAVRFPAEITFRVARVEGRVVAGVVLFSCGLTVHAQYIAASPFGTEFSALDQVLSDSIDQANAAGARYFDFGISTDAEGAILNEGLYQFKSEFGASGVVHEFFDLDLARPADASR